MALNGTKRAAFFDKDGTLVRNVPYNVKPSLITLYPDSIQSLLRLQSAGYELFIVSNQPGVAHGMFDETALCQALVHLRDMFQAKGVYITDCVYCPHHPMARLEQYRVTCGCRKPQPGLLQAAANQYGIALDESWMIGDILNDVEAGNRARCRTILLDNGNETEWQKGSYREPFAITKTLDEAASHVLAN